MSENYHGVMVKKPWGREYLLYENNHVAIWHLLINEGHETSLHCHPNKKTGLINIKGKAELSFLNNRIPLEFFDKAMIRQGVFHSTKAIGDVVELLEIETPVNKGDIVRIKDKYGRAGKPYEGQNFYFPYKCPKDLNYKEYLGDVSISKVSFVSHFILEPSTKYMFLEGGLKSDDYIVCGPGDLITSENLQFLIQEFETLPSTLLCIRSAKN